MSINDKTKTHCYSSKCGPVVTTGAVQSIWYVCRECKCEVTPGLKEQIEERIAIREESKIEDTENNKQDPDDPFGFGFWPL